MYLAHHLITVEKMISRSNSLSRSTADVDLRDSPYQKTSSLDVAEPGRLRDLVATVKKLGNDHFSRHINSLKKQLGDVLSPANGIITFV